MSSHQSKTNSGHPLVKYLARAFIRRQSKVFLTEYPQLAVYSFDLITNEILINGIFENEFLDALEINVFSKLKKREICLDIGANIGNHSIFFLRHFSRVYAFEPNPRALRLLYLNVESLPNISVFPIGLSDSKRKIVLSEVPGNLGSARAIDSAGCNSQTVDVSPLDAVTGIGADGHVDFIKIDVEGHETSVIRGACELLRRDGPVLAIELLNKTLSEAEPPIIREIRGLGYKYFYEFVPDGVLARFPRRVWKLSKVFAGLFFGKTLNIHRRIRPIDVFESHNYPMVICSRTPLT
jgi:FkbM family methyltransferase